MPDESLIVRFYYFPLINIEKFISVFMDDRTRENWQKIKDTMEASGNTKNMFYKRSCEVMRTGVDPMEKMWNNK